MKKYEQFPEWLDSYPRWLTRLQSWLFLMESLFKRCEDASKTKNEQGRIHGTRCA